MASSVSCRLVFMNLYNPSPWVWVPLLTQLLKNRTGQKRMMFASRTRLQKYSGFCLADSEGSQMTCWVDVWRPPRGKGLREASSHQPTRAWGSQTNAPQGTATCQQPCDRTWMQILPYLSLDMIIILMAALGEILTQRTQLPSMSLSLFL